jgi:hypothetical protein
MSYSTIIEFLTAFLTFFPRLKLSQSQIIAIQNSLQSCMDIVNSKLDETTKASISTTQTTNK